MENSFLKLNVSIDVAVNIYLDVLDRPSEFELGKARIMRLEPALFACDVRADKLAVIH